MKILADTATLIPPDEADAYGLTVIPVSVAINGHTYSVVCFRCDLFDFHRNAGLDNIYIPCFLCIDHRAASRKYLTSDAGNGAKNPLDKITS